MDRNVLGYLTDLNRNAEGALTLLEKLADLPKDWHFTGVECWHNWATAAPRSRPTCTGPGASAWP